MKVSRFFTRGFALILTMAVTLFAPTLAAADGVSYQDGDLLRHSLSTDYDQASDIHAAGVYLYTLALDEPLAPSAYYYKSKTSLFDVVALRRLNWLAINSVTLSFQHELYVPRLKHRRLSA